MSKGENIFKRKDGRWEARYIKGYELSGKIRYGFCYGRTYQEAKEKVAHCKAALVYGAAGSATRSRQRLSFYCGEWLRMKKLTVKESTYIILCRYVAFYNRQRPCFAIGYDTPDNYCKRFYRGELEKKDTFSKRILTEEPKFVQKRKDAEK